MPNRLFTTATAVVTLLAVAALPTAAAGAALPSKELMLWQGKNGGAEANLGAADEGYVAPAVWTAPTGARLMGVVQYGVSTFPAPTTFGGTNFFAGGPDSPLSSGVVELDISPWIREVDSMQTEVWLAADLGGWQTQSDWALVSIDAAGKNQLLQLIGPTAAQRQNQTELISQAKAIQLWPGTRRLTVRMTAVRVHGAYNDGYVDSIAVKIRRLPARVAGTAALDRDCTNNRILAGLRVLPRQSFSRVTFTLGSRVFTDRAKPYYAQFGRISDATTGTLKVASYRSNGTLVKQVARRVPPCSADVVPS